MPIIHEIENITIDKKKDNEFSIENETEFDLGIISDFFDKSDIISKSEKQIKFKALEVEPLKAILKKNDNKLEYMMVVNLLHNLASIKNKLEKEGLMFVNLDIGDIIVIDSSKFLFINYNNIYEINKKEIVVDKVLKLSDLNEKSMKEIDEIPFRISIKSVYYNIANLLVYCLFNKVYKDEETINPIYYTKLYWFLTRCLNNNRDDRVFLFI
jgi:hypothetical protein